MRIAILTHEPFYPPSGGGSSEAVYLVRELVRRGHSVDVFCPEIPDADLIASRFNIRFHLFTGFRMGRYASLRTPKYLLYPFCLERLFLKTTRNAPRHDLLLSLHAISAVTAARLRKRLGIPTVMNYLDFLTGFMETWPKWLMPPPLLAALMRYEVSLPSRSNADAVLAVSDTLADRVAAAGYPRAQIRPIYFGYDAASFPLTQGAVASRPSDPPTLVMHGSFDRHHLGPIALDALARVHARHPGLTLRFVGRETPSLNEFLRKLAIAAPGIQTVRTGFVPYTEIAAQLEGATLGIVPYEESTGTHCAFVAKLVEYLALGLPVASTRIQSACSYFKDEPLARFSDFNGAAFADVILGWLAEPREKRNALALPAHQRVRNSLDWEIVCRNAATFIEQTLQATPQSQHPHPRAAS